MADKQIYTEKQLHDLNKANDVAKKCSIKFDALERDYNQGVISKEIFETECNEIEMRLANVWLNNEFGGGRAPVFLKDLEVPENLKGFYESIFIDF